MMGQRGPQPLPANVHMLRGNLSKKPLSELLGEFRPPAALPKIPKLDGKPVLNDAARAIWRRIGERLESLGLVAEIDESALVAYCNDYAEYLQAQRKVDELNAAEPDRLPGFLQSTPTGYMAKSVWLTIRDKAHDRLRASEAKFGIGAAARSRVTPSEVNQPELPGIEQKPATGWGSI